MDIISLKFSKECIKLLKQDYHDYLVSNNNTYVNFCIKFDDVTITCYTSDKVVFQGKNISSIVSKYITNNYRESAGSDEVGTGDSFGPIVVCCCVITKDNFDFLKQFNLSDSKQLNDRYIIEIAPKLMKNIKHSLLILDNEKYNKIHQSKNKNEILALMHNQAYINLKNKGIILPKQCVIDQFVSKDNYFKYLLNEKEVVYDLIFETKAEEKYIAVAIASIIARFTFIKTMEILSNKYQMHFPKGSSDVEIIEDTIQEFLSKYPKDELSKVCKLHFKNIQEYLDMLQ